MPSTPNMSRNLRMLERT